MGLIDPIYNQTPQQIYDAIKSGKFDDMPEPKATIQEDDSEITLNVAYAVAQGGGRRLYRKAKVKANSNGKAEPHPNAEWELAHLGDSKFI